MCHHIQHRLAIKARVLGECHALGQGLNEARDTDLVDHFGQLPGPCPAHQAAGFGEGINQRFGAGVFGCVPAAHDGEDTVFGPSLAA